MLALGRVTNIHIANLVAEDIDWNDRIISYAHRKTGSRAFVHFGSSVETILRSVPAQGLSPAPGTDLPQHLCINSLIHFVRDNSDRNRFNLRSTCNFAYQPQTVFRSTSRS